MEDPDMQDPTPLKQAGEDLIAARNAEVIKLVEEDIENMCISAAYLLLGLDEEAFEHSIKNDNTYGMAELIGIDVQDRIDFHANRIQQGG